MYRDGGGEECEEWWTSINLLFQWILIGNQKPSNQLQRIHYKQINMDDF